ncbi:MAG TPA: T9SS type A sorting domain-containing protein [Moheibacter sp.]|nr:T9SS type A sorting domain-containing protein [Moheibacter sp.]
MKNLFTPLIFGMACMINAQSIITYSTQPFNPIMGESTSCNGNTETVGNAFSWDNRVSRSFFLTDFDIQNDFQIHKVSFAVQNIIFLPQDGYPVTVNLYTSEGAYPNGELTLIGTKDVVITQDDFHTVDVDLEALVPAGSELVMEIHYNGEDIVSALYIGANGQNDNQPAYIQAEMCDVFTPVEVATIGAPGAKWLMSIEGEDTLLGTIDVINSSKISVYPNPVAESFSIQKENSQEILQVELFDHSGKKIKTYANRFENISVSDLPEGIYLIKIHTLTGKVFNQKLIKK